MIRTMMILLFLAVLIHGSKADGSKDTGDNNDNEISQSGSLQGIAAGVAAQVKQGLQMAELKKSKIVQVKMKSQDSASTQV